MLTAESGAQALELAPEHDFAVILLDVMMPELDGLGTLERLRRIPRAKHTPVILLTAYHPERETIERAYALGTWLPHRPESRSPGGGRAPPGL